MIDLLSTITTAFNEDLDYLIPDGIYLSKAPDDAPLPLAVMTIISDVPDYSTQNEYGQFPYIEQANIQFDIYAETDSAVLSALEMVDQAFNHTSLVTAGDAFIHGRRVGGIPASYQDGAWRGTYEYRFWVSRLA